MKIEARQQSRYRILRFRTSPEGKDTQPLYAGFIQIPATSRSDTRYRFDRKSSFSSTCYCDLGGHMEEYYLVLLPKSSTAGDYQGLKASLLSAYIYGTQSGSGGNLKGCSSVSSSLTMLRR